MLDHPQSAKLQAFFKSGRQLNYQKNEIILRAQDTPQGVYFIESGLVKVYSLSKQGDEHVHHFFGPGDFFPMIWTFRKIDRNLFYEALAPTKLWVVPRQQFLNFTKENEDVLFELLEELIDRYHRYAGRIDNLLYSDARERCAYRLLSLANRYGQKADNGLVIDVSITHEDMAHSINMTRETFGRTLNRLQKRGIIDYDARRCILIKDLPALIAIIGKAETQELWPNIMKHISVQ